MQQTLLVGGMLVLGSHGSPSEKLFMEVAAGVTKTCHHMYTEMATGIAPESVTFQNGVMHAGARYNIQRPEAIEAIFYMYRKTGAPVYREWAWEMFSSMVKQYKTPTGWVGLKDVHRNPPQKDDTMVRLSTSNVNDGPSSLFWNENTLLHQASTDEMTK